MIFNKSISLILTGLFYLFLVLLFTSISAMFLNGMPITFVGTFLLVIFFFIARIFYNYLRNDDQYKNTRQSTSDWDGERYITKGESDPKKIFIVVWIIVILILTCVQLWLFSYNNGLV